MFDKPKEVSFNDFEKFAINAGTVRQVEYFSEAHKPALKLWIDFGENIGELKTSAQITQNYDKSNLIGKTVVALTNIPPKQIGSFKSECLVLGFSDKFGNVVLISPDTPIANGALLF